MLTLRESSLDWALNHALIYGDTDVFPVPFEYQAIQHDWTNLRKFLSQQNVLEWQTRPQRTLLSPKARYGFRVITQLDPLDFLLFAALIYELGSDLESIRVPVGRNVVFSYRYSCDPQGRLYDPNIGYPEFQKKCKRIISKKKITHVVITDIADFYPRIYLHRLENALRCASQKTSHVNAVIRLLSGWNGTETFGIPVGKAPSRLLAEITISDIDNALLDNDIQFVRFNDDYRLFVKSHSEGYRCLAFLADFLYKNHGLTLQPQKTMVIDVEEFRSRFLPTSEDRAIDTLHEKFQELIADLQLSDPYEEIDYEDLTDEQKETVNSFNLKEMFLGQIQGSNDPDLGIVSFVLRRMGQLGDSSLVNDIFNNLDVLYPVFPDIIRYFRKLRDLSSRNRKKIGDRVLSLLKKSIVSKLEYHRMWALELFTHSTEWDNEEKFLRLLSSFPDSASRRKLILALGRASKQHWFQSRWRDLLDESAWPRRALIAAASCLPADARGHLYRSIDSKLDPLEKAVMRWAKQNPFGQQ